MTSSMAVEGAPLVARPHSSHPTDFAGLSAREKALAGVGALLLLLVVAVAVVARSAGGRQAAPPLRLVAQRQAPLLKPPACGGPLNLPHPALQGPAACRVFNRVCFDQGTVVSFDPAHSPANPQSARIPELNLGGLRYNWPGSKDGDNGDRFPNSNFGYEPLTFRPAANLEPTPDLRAPAFSNCTVPLVVWSMYMFNPEEFLSHVVSRIWLLQADGALHNGSLLVLGTPGGQALFSYHKYLLEPFTQHPVLTLAELSARQGAAAGGAGPPPHPYGRCFQTAYLCAIGGGMGYFPSMYSAMRAVYKAHERRLPPPPYPPFARGAEVLKVVLEHRSSTVRNILNWERLVQQCNEHAAWQLDPASPIKRVQCRAATFGSDTAANLAAVGGADVLLTVHGAGAMNWLAMAEGSALVELRPYKFGSENRDWAEAFFRPLSEAINYAVHWYCLNIEDEAASRPSQREQEGLDPGGAFYNRDRHTVLPFSALRAVLRRVAAAGRDRQRYLAQRQAGQLCLEVLPGEKLGDVPPPGSGEQGP